MTTTGCVQILARDKVRGGYVDVNGLDIVAADARGEKERPHGYGVYVINAADRWTAEAKITSHGPSGIGFVNFGIVHELKVNAPIETFGQGARGFNVYTGTVNLAEFDRVVTHADDAWASKSASRSAGLSCTAASRRSAVPALRWSRAS